MEVAGLGVTGALALAKVGEGEKGVLAEATPLGVPKPALLLGEEETEAEGLSEEHAVALAKREGDSGAVGEAEPAPLPEEEPLLLAAGESVAEALALELAVAQ